jgi:hypothetical protein
MEARSAELRELRLMIEVALPDTVDQHLVVASAGFCLECFLPLLPDPLQDSLLSSLRVLENGFGRLHRPTDVCSYRRGWLLGRRRFIEHR